MIFPPSEAGVSARDYVERYGWDMALVEASARLKRIGCASARYAVWQ